ncbi:MAG TPA: hypothetical protein VGI64_08095 [Streptosporangiaceae bacterium]|jgi:hypothetical protein
MVLLIGGLIFGFIAIITVTTTPVVTAIMAVGAIVFIAAGVQNLSGNDPNKALEAMNRLQREGPAAAPVSAEQIQRFTKEALRSSPPCNAQQIWNLQALALRSGHPLSAEEIRQLEARAKED